MPQLVHDVMTPRVIAVAPDTPVAEAAQLMREHDIGNVLVCEGDRLLGLVTDRDITLRVLADGADPRIIDVGTVCTPDPVCIGPEEGTEHAAALMRRHAVRRLPVVSTGRAIGMVSIGDLTEHRDPDSTLADISRAEPSPDQGTVAS
ncbi:CBS domain-containing protein [Streptomyces sp. BH097]|uniref:CBS domain-containing protein n=1 Tax=unclassified Streptomyces TaxID=2593676 RepID=UPI003BB567CC